MKRALTKELIEWSKQKNRLPLLLRGARQVGKSFLVEQFAKQYFKNFVEVNFELEPNYNKCFNSLSPVNIINEINSFDPTPIIPGETLLFLDEIQNCPQAILALRYFKEKLPDLHIIAAGSLLEFILNQPDFSIPVGRIQYIFLKPLSFIEFLKAQDFISLIEIIQNANLKNPIESHIHQRLLDLTREYFMIGGMPAAINEYLDSKQYIKVQRQHTLLLNTYRDDFGKYAKQTNHSYLQSVFSRTPAMIGQQIKYNKIDPDVRSRELKQAIQNLTYAGVLQPIYHTNASGIPLELVMNEKKFKLLYLDIGLANKAAQVSYQELLNTNINLINHGAMAEQFVGQELLAYHDCYEEAKLYFWARDAVGSNAEVDYVTTFNSQIIPIEVKAGSVGRLKSLKVFMQEKNSSQGIRISTLPLKAENGILTVPFYMISQLPRLLSDY